MLIVFFIIACGESSKKNVSSELITTQDKTSNVSVIEQPSESIIEKNSIVVKTGTKSNSTSRNPSSIKIDPIEDSIGLDKNKTIDISNLSQTEQAKYRIKQASDKADCMIEYLNRKEAGEIQLRYEEFCK